MKNKRIFFKIILSIFFIVLIVNSPTKIKAGFWDDIFGQGQDFIQKGNKGIESEGDIKVTNAEIFKILSTIGMVTTVVVGGILGIKFMLASAEDKAKIKESMMPYVLGGIVIFGAFSIWRLVVLALDGI